MQNYKYSHQPQKSASTLLAGVIIVGKKNEETHLEEFEMEEEALNSESKEFFTRRKVFNMDEETELVCNMVYAYHRVSLETAKKLKILAMFIAFLTIASLGALTILNLVYGSFLKNYNTIFFSISCLLDCLTSATVVWRYFGANTSLYSSRKESTACIIQAGLLYTEAVNITIRSLFSLIHFEIPVQSKFIIYIELGTAVLCCALAITKMVVAWKLESVSIMSDGISSIVGFLLGTGSVVAGVVFNTDYDIWFINGVVGVVVALLIAIYATAILLHTLRLRNKDQQMEERSYMYSN